MSTLIARPSSKQNETDFTKLVEEGLRASITKITENNYKIMSAIKLKEDEVLLYAANYTHQVMKKADIDKSPILSKMFEKSAKSNKLAFHQHGEIADTITAIRQIDGGKAITFSHVDRVELIHIMQTFIEYGISIEPLIALIMRSHQFALLPLQFKTLSEICNKNINKITLKIEYNNYAGFYTEEMKKLGEVLIPLANYNLDCGYFVNFADEKFTSPTMYLFYKTLLYIGAVRHNFSCWLVAATLTHDSSAVIQTFALYRNFFQLHTVTYHECVAIAKRDPEDPALSPVEKAKTIAEAEGHVRMARDRPGLIALYERSNPADPYCMSKEQLIDYVSSHSYMGASPKLREIVSEIRSRIT